jgi:protein-L-isoaspartate(D-aspartate) O-methyltransferase
MLDFAVARRMMVDGQVRTADVTDLRLITAMETLPRERFVPAQLAALAYLDRDLPLTDAANGRPRRCLLKPMVLAKLVHALDLSASEHVLDVGCASGYSSALLARLAGSVVALEEEPELAKLATAGLAQESNITVVSGPLSAGWSRAAPYDAILMGGAVEAEPLDLCRQLKDGGRLVCVLGPAPSGKAMMYRRDGSDVSARPIFDASAAVLPGFSKSPAFAF